MEHIELVIERSVSEKLLDSEESSDFSRDEEKWSSKLNEFLLKIKSDCEKSSENHNKVSKLNLWYYRMLSIPCIILPMISAVLNQYLDEKYGYISSLTMICSGTLSGISILYNFGKLAQLHNDYSGKYAILSKQISYTLSRSKKNRNACDVTCQRFILENEKLDNSAPQI